MILLNQYITFCIANLFAGISTGNTIFQTFDCFLTIHESKYFHTWDFIFSFGTVNLTNNQFLANINHSTCQITGVGCTKSGIRHTLSSTMCRHEVLQYIKSFTEVGLDRQLDCTTCCISHQTTHTSQLFDLLVRTTGTGVSHHEDVVILIQTIQQCLSQLIISFFPCFYYCFITFFFCHKTTSEVHCDAVYSSLCISQHLRLLSRHCHIGNRYSHCSSCRIFITHSLDAIQYFCSLSSTMDVDNLFKDLL